MELEDSVIEEGAKGIVEELADWHFLMILWLFDKFQQVVEHVLVRARVNTIIKLLLGPMTRLNLLDKEFHFLLEIFVTICLIFLTCWIEFDLNNGWVLMVLEHVQECLFALLGPCQVFVLLEFQFLKRCVIH